MAYMFIDDEAVEDGMEVADVVDRSEYDAVITERDEVITERDEAIVRAESVESELKDLRNKYAKTFLSTPNSAKAQQKADVLKDGKTPTMSYSSLFSGRKE